MVTVKKDNATISLHGGAGFRAAINVPIRINLFGSGEWYVFSWDIPDNPDPSREYIETIGYAIVTLTTFYPLDEQSGTQYHDTGVEYGDEVSVWIRYRYRRTDTGSEGTALWTTHAYRVFSEE